MITEEQAEQAHENIRLMAERYGELVGLCKYLDHKRRTIRSQAFLNASGSSVAEREAKAETDAEYLAVIEEIKDAETEKATIATKIKGWELCVDIWRSENAQRRL